MAIDETALTRLEDVGRRQGRISAEDLGRILPVDRMSPGDIARVVERLESAGIDVDVDPALLHGRSDGGAAAGDAGVVSIARPAAPAVSAPGVRPSTSHDAASMGSTHGHGTRRAPTWNYEGVDLIPIVSIGAVALLLIVALA
ncbi:hypothetical protein [Azospirillum halopraeferens]|uniref:hypothetical protein n=1 Tax=Azospirillum halopraeferens TaxID=34010 RepID=UPI00040D8182|nr:hypothetical protein [Azospirillum halopraeferens]